MKITTHSEAGTRAAAKKLATRLTGGETIGLVGDLGAGKTAFTKGLAAALGVTATVTSPTFVLMKVYPSRHRTIRHVVHVDAYRLRGGASLKAIGLDDYIGAPDSVVIIEWADRVKKIVPKGARIITFMHAADSERIITL